MKNKTYYWFLDSWNGDVCRFPSFRAAKKAAKSQYGANIAICGSDGSVKIVPASGFTPA